MSQLSKALIIIAVSSYLLIVLTYLVITRQLSSPGFKKCMLYLLRPKYSAEIRVFTHDKGHCWRASVPSYLCSDSDSASTLELYEDGCKIGPSHAVHDEIREKGSGRYSHWRAIIYFSPSDNSDPSQNGRTYKIKER